MVMFSPKNLMKRSKSHSIRKPKDICIMKASDVSKPHMLIELKYTTPSIYLIKSRCNSAGSHVNTLFTPFTALLETLLLINSEFKGGGGVFKASVKKWQLIS